MRQSDLLPITLQMLTDFKTLLQADPTVNLQ